MVWYLKTRQSVAGWLCAALMTCTGVIIPGTTGPTALAQNATRTPAAAVDGAEAGPVDLAETGLALAPSDAAFFHTSLNMRKGWQELEQGWLAEVRRVPYVQQLEIYLQQQWDSPEPQAAQAKAFLSSPIAQDILHLIADMSAQECFVYGEHSWAEFFGALSTFQTQLAELTAAGPEAMREHILQLEKSDIDAIPLPTTVLGFQLSDDANARTQLDALQGVLQLVLGSSDELKQVADGLRRKDLENGQILSFTLEANDIPWQNVPGADDEEMSDVIDHMSELLEDRKVVISLAVIENRLLLAISENADTLLQMGHEENLLASDTLEQLTSNLPADLRAVSYASGQWKAAVWNSNFGNYFERLALQFSAPVVAQAENPEDLEEWRDKLIADCQWLDERIAELMPDFAESLAYSFVTPEGTETLAYDWTPSVLLENAQPLAVASHGGTGPLILAASRQRQLDQVTEIIDAVMAEVPAHARSLIESGIIDDEDEAEKIQEIVDGVWPIIEDMYAAVRDEIGPSLDANESLISITALATINQLGDDAPPPPVPLPLPEVALVLKLQDKDQFLGGCDQFVSGINRLLDFIRQQDPDAVPDDARIPPPDEEELPGGGTRYSYPSNAPAPLEQFQLQMAINDEVAVVGYSTRQVLDMFKSRPLAARPAWYDEDQPTAAVGFVDCAGIFKAMKPWVHYALSATGKELSEPLAVAEGDVPVPTGADILQIWDTFRRLGKAAGTTVIDEDGVIVSHWIWVAE